MAAADASFKTSMDSMSLGLISETELKVCPEPTLCPCKSKEVERLELLSLSSGMPSTTYSGALLPRTLTNRPAPGVPEALITFRPATRPCILAARFDTGWSRISAPLSEEIAPVTWLLRWAPYPTMTTSSKRRSSGSSTMSNCVWLPTGTSLTAKPV